MATQYEQAAAGAVLAFVKTGEYPETNQLVSAELSSDSLGVLHEQIHEVRGHIHAEIRRISRQAAPDVDEWIRRAKQLHADIEQSRVLARDIVAQATEAKQLDTQRVDVRGQVELLQNEVGFNSNLQHRLHEIKAAAAQLQSAQQLGESDQIEASLHKLQDLELSLEYLGGLQSTHALELLRQRVEDLRGTLTQQANDLWNETIQVKSAEHKLTIRRQAHASQRREETSIEDTIKICASLNLLESNALKLARDLQRHILLPLFAASGTPTEPGLCREDDSLILQTGRAVASKPAILEALETFCQFLTERLPADTCQIISEALMPAISSRLESHELSWAVPASVRDTPNFEALLVRVRTFNDCLTAAGWTPATTLIQWTSSAPKVWLTKRREASINELRQILSAKVRERRTAERVETQEVGIDEVATTTAHIGDEHDWNEDWDHEQPRTPARSAQADDEDEHGTKEDDEWGWDEQEPEDREGSQLASPVSSRKDAGSAKKFSVNGSGHSRKQLTLRETYQVTGVAHEIKSLTLQLIEDAKELGSGDSPIASAANALLSIPTLLVATYRALAPTRYELLPGGLMLLYNDSTWLGEQLARTHGSFPEANSPMLDRLKLGEDAESLNSFARRAYGRAMDAQRTIVRDLVDNAQGFTNCTSQPYASACDDAVAATVAHVRAMAAEWGGILSRSALLQSLGSILATVISKIILDIEEMSDIGDDESKQLRRYCQEICKLNDLFPMEQAEHGEEAQDVASLYTPNWIKFQYMIELLESSLADIKYLWTEAEGLRYEYDVDELVDLIEALFADNDHRRRAIAEIRR